MTATLQLAVNKSYKSLKVEIFQDKLLNIANKMLEELEPGLSARLREHRAKFPGT